MKHIGLIVLLFVTALLAACEQKPYQPPVPHTGQDKAKSVEKAADQASRGREEEAGKTTGY